MKPLSDVLFKKILSKRKRDTGVYLEQVGFYCQYNNYSLNFYGNLEDGHQLRVEHLGVTNGGEWSDIDPTEAQEAEMQRILYEEVKVVEEEIKRSEPIFDDDFNYSKEYNNSFL